MQANKQNFKLAAELGNMLRKLAEESTKPKALTVAPPAWKPKGGVPTFPTLESHERAIRKAYSEGQGFVRGTVLTKTTLQAIASYQNGGFEAINSVLWNGGVSAPGASPTVVKRIGELDKAMSLSSVPFNIEVVRSKGQGSALWHDMNILNVGDVYTTPAFDSASVNKNNNWGGGGVRVFYRLPKGAKAIFMNALSASENAIHYNSTHPGEYECLIARNSSWRVVGKEVDGQGKITVTVELVAQNKPEKGK